MFAEKSYETIAYVRVSILFIKRLAIVDFPVPDMPSITSGIPFLENELIINPYFVDSTVGTVNSKNYLVG